MDLGNRIITIPVPFSKNKEVRYVPINDRVMEILQRLPSRMKSDWVFPSATNITPLHGGMWAAKFFNPAVKEAKIAPLHWHCLRHTFASRLVMRGNDLRTVQELLGHRKIEMTLRYSHLSPAHKMTAVQTLVEEKIEGQIDPATDTERKKATKGNE